MAYTEAAAGLTSYYAEIRQVRLLTPEQECVLVGANLRLLAVIAHEFAEAQTRFADQPNKLQASPATTRRSTERIAI
jgi:hypothetical protein